MIAPCLDYVPDEYYYDSQNNVREMGTHWELKTHWPHSQRTVDDFYTRPVFVYGTYSDNVISHEPMATRQYLEDLRELALENFNRTGQEQTMAATQTILQPLQYKHSGLSLR